MNTAASGSGHTATGSLGQTSPPAVKRFDDCAGDLRAQLARAEISPMLHYHMLG